MCCFLTDVTHLNERVRLDGRGICLYNPLKLQETLFFENNMEIKLYE